ncbi:MAG: hypothetical protein KGM49_03795 [Sphingomonadales bacterium]|nr:hypothetical protein [Sphingomonadales bacterium]
MKSSHAAAFVAAFAAAICACGTPAQARYVRGGTGHSLSAGLASENLWHLRAGLNVAALSCRGDGRDAVAPAYSRLLSRHRSLLASAYTAEHNRHRADLDRHLTTLYNRFSMQSDPGQFCSRAAGVAQEAGAMDSPTLARNAGTLLARIN